MNSWRDFFKVKNINVTYVNAEDIYGFENDTTIDFSNQTENIVQGKVALRSMSYTKKTVEEIDALFVLLESAGIQISLLKLT